LHFNCDKKVSEFSRKSSREIVSMVTPSDESKPDLDQIKSKMIRFPEEILMAQIAPLSTNQSFRPEMAHYEFEISKTCLEDKVKQFRALFDRSVENFGRENDTELKNQIERKFVDLVRNSCTSEFLVENGRDLAGENTFKGALSFISDVFGSETEEERKEEAKNQLDKLARRTEKNEKFESFLKRIKSLARQFVEQEAVNFYVSEKFKSMIEPSNITFLKNNCYYQKSAEDIAKFLDARERHMIAHVSAVGASQLNTFMDETSEVLNKQLQAIYDNNKKIQEAHESKNAEFSKAIKDLTAKISELTVAKKSENSVQNAHSFVPQQSQNSGYPSFQPNFPAQNYRFQNFQAGQNFTGQNVVQGGQNFNGQNQGQNRFPLFCNQCGKPGHTKRRCRFVICNVCKAQGHVQKDCPKFPQRPSAPHPRDLSGN
jgi:hypothetical protein